MDARSESDRWVRPYAITGGRTKPTREIPIESLVITAAAAHGSDDVKGDWQTIIDLCEQPVSVAEIAARCGYVLGVARVLVSDLMDANLVRVSMGLDQLHEESTPTQESNSHIALLERVLNGLQSL